MASKEADSGDEADGGKAGEYGDEAVVKKPALKYDTDILDFVGRHFSEDPSEAAHFDAWVDERCQLIDLDKLAANAKGDEAMHELEYTELHEDFKAMYEARLEAFIEQNGWTVPELYEKIRFSQDISNGASAASLIGEIMLTTFDYDVFFLMMKEAAEAKRLDRGGGHK